MISIKEIKNHPYVQEFIYQTEITLEALEYTEHAFRHANLVSERSAEIAKKIGLSKKEQEIAAIVGFCHDMGNFLGRQQHHYWSALLFNQLFQKDFSPQELSYILQAIVNHDKQMMKIVNKISAITILADKSDVHRSRVTLPNIKSSKADIHDRVNYATTKSMHKIDPKKKRITLILKIDTKFCSIMEYFEIFTERMTYCREAANYLGYKFGLVINNFKLL